MDINRMNPQLIRILGTGQAILQFGAYLFLRLPAFFKWLFNRLLALLTFFVVSLLYVFSLPVPILGKIILESESRDWTPTFSIRDRVQSFRGVVIEIMAIKHTTSGGRTRNELRTAIEFNHLKAKKKHEIGELVFSFWGGVVAVLIGLFNLWSSFSQVLSVYVLVITVSILVRILVIDILAFNRTDAKDEIRKDDLELMLGWNKAILNSIKSQLAILFLGLLGWVHGPSYEMAKKALKTYAEKGLTKRGLVRELIKESR